MDAISGGSYHTLNNNRGKMLSKVSIISGVSIFILLTQSCASSPTEKDSRFTWEALMMGAPKPIVGSFDLGYNNYPPEEDSWKIVNPTKDLCFGQNGENINPNICLEVRGFMSDVNANIKTLTFNEERAICHTDISLDDMKKCVQLLNLKINKSNEILSKYKNISIFETYARKHYLFVTFADHLNEIKSLSDIKASIVKTAATNESEAKENKVARDTVLHESTKYKISSDEYDLDLARSDMVVSGGGTFGQIIYYIINSKKIIFKNIKRSKEDGLDVMVLKSKIPLEEAEIEFKFIIQKGYVMLYRVKLMNVVLTGAEAEVYLLSVL